MCCALNDYIICMHSVHYNIKGERERERKREKEEEGKREKEERGSERGRGRGRGKEGGRRERITVFLPL